MDDRTLTEFMNNMERAVGRMEATVEGTNKKLDEHVVDPEAHPQLKSKGWVDTTTKITLVIGLLTLVVLYLQLQGEKVNEKLMSSSSDVSKLDRNR